MTFKQVLEHLDSRTYDALDRYRIRTGVPVEISFFYSDGELKEIHGIADKNVGKIKALREQITEEPKNAPQK